jgi:hypothetical protein
MRRYALALCIVLWPVVPLAAEGASPVEGKLEVTVKADGVVKAEAILTNHSGRNLCMLPGWNEAFARDADGKMIGNFVEYTLLWPDSIDVVWDDEWPDRFQVQFNPPDLTLTAEQKKRFVRASYSVSFYDCLELFTLGQRAKPKMEQNFEGTPVFLH